PLTISRTNNRAPSEPSAQLQKWSLPQIIRGAIPPNTPPLKEARPRLAKGAENGKWNAQRHRSRRGTCDADNVSTNPTLDTGRDKGKRRAIGFLSRRAAFGGQVRRD